MEGVSEKKETIDKTSHTPIRILLYPCTSSSLPKDMFNDCNIHISLKKAI